MSDLPLVSVLAGAEPFLAHRYLVELTERALPPAARGFNHDVLDAKAAGPAGILNAARTVPMMAARRMVVVRDLEALGADGMNDLIPYLEAPVPSTVLVLLAGRLDGRLKLLQVAKKKGYLVELEIPRPLAPWIRAEAQRRGARMTDDAARRLAEIVGGELGRLASSVEQLALYAAGEPAITAAHVDDLVAETRERTVFELANAVGQGDRDRALRAVGNLFDQRESAVGLAMMLARHVRHLALVREHMAQRTPRADLPRLVGVPPFAVDGLVAQARRFRPGTLERAVALLAKADVDLKSPVKSALGERIVVERLIGDLLELGGTPR